MCDLKEFIEVTSIYDGRKAMIRASCIDSVVDNASEEQDFGVKPEHRRINFAGNYLEVSEGYEEICGMIYKAELDTITSSKRNMQLWLEDTPMRYRNHKRDKKGKLESVECYFVENRNVITEVK